ncbi:hypothetical protein [Streptomyces sp. NPDC054834]
MWENKVTVRSTRAARMYEPGTWITRVSPTPLLVVVALGDAVTVTDLALAAYERALEPKRLQPIPGGHFDPYTGQFDQASGAPAPGSVSTSPDGRTHPIGVHGTIRERIMPTCADSSTTASARWC